MRVSCLRSIEDGFLAPFKVISIMTDIGDGWRPRKGQRDIYGNVIEDRIYTNSDYDYLDAFRLENGLYRDAIGSDHTALHSVVLPLYYGITEAKDVVAAVALIRQKRLCCGVYMAYFVLKALARNGEFELMQQLLFSEDIHSWGNMLKEGATSCWEAWGRDQKGNTSLCHPWASAPVIIMLEDLAGIRAAEPGFRTISFQPHMPEWLGDVELNFGTVRGVISARRIAGKWELSLDGAPVWKSA